MLSQNTWDINALREMRRCTVHLAAYSAAGGHRGATPLRFSRDVQVLFLESSSGDWVDFTVLSSDKPSPASAEVFPELQVLFPRYICFSCYTSTVWAGGGREGRCQLPWPLSGAALVGWPGWLHHAEISPQEMFNNIINNVLVVVLRSKQLWGSSKNLAIAGKCNVRHLCAKFVYLHQPVQLHL